MKKWVVYGVGEALKNRISYFDINQIEAFVDSNPQKNGIEIYGKKIYSPCEIVNMNYDLIIISSKKYYKEIVCELCNNYDIDYKKIISIQHFIGMLEVENSYISTQVLDSVVHIINQQGLEKILEAGTCFEKSKVLLEKNVSIQHINFEKMNNLKEIKAPIVEGKVYDIFVCIAPFLKYSIGEFIEILKKIGSTCRQLIFTIPRYGSGEHDSWIKYDYSFLGNIEIKEVELCLIFKIDTSRNISKQNIEVFVVSHKQFELPTKDEVYIPIYVGKSCMENSKSLTDETGNNISRYNKKINECTALYWIWKNNNNQYIGLNHYRRYFSSEMMQNTIISNEEIEQLLGKYDILIAERQSFYPKTIRVQLGESMNYHLLEFAYSRLRNLIEKKQPLFLDAFDEVMEGYSLYPCNLFITSRKIMAAYCEWLFSLIIELADQIDVKSYDDYSKRVVGFLAERLLTVWLIKQEYRKKELKIHMIENP